MTALHEDASAAIGKVIPGSEDGQVYAAAVISSWLIDDGAKLPVITYFRTKHSAKKVVQLAEEMDKPITPIAILTLKSIK